MILRPYQSAALDQLRALLLRGAKRLALIAPTGSGKTVMFSEIIRSATARGKRSLVLAHRRELIDQTIEKLTAFGVAAGVIMADDPRRDDHLPVQVASIQTLANRLDRLPPADLIITDEAHHAVSPSYRAVLDAYPDAIVIGPTATPWRLDRFGLADIFEGSVVAATPAELMAIGALVNYDAFAYDSPDLHDVGLVAGEFNQRDLGLACNTDVLVGSVVREYIAHANTRRAILFPVNVEHSRALVAEFQSAGVVAEHVDAKTPTEIRKQAMVRFRTGDLVVLSSVGVLTEGFDAPAAEVCILARPTKSLSLHLQMIGRVLRPSPETGKARALIHDHAGNLLRHGLVEDERDYSLTATPSRVRELHTCPFCCVLFGRIGADGTCPRCHELIAMPSDVCQTCGCVRDAAVNPCACGRAGAGREAKTNVEGKRIDINEIRARRAAAGLTRDLSDRQLARVATATRAEKIAELRRLQAIAEDKGFKPGFVAHQFREVFGAWPSAYRFTDDELASTEPAERPFIPLPPRKREAA